MPNVKRQEYVLLKEAVDTLTAIAHEYDISVMVCATNAQYALSQIEARRMKDNDRTRIVMNERRKVNKNYGR